MLVISNRPRASRSSNFEIIHRITPWIVLYSVQLLWLIVSMTKFSIVIGSPWAYLSRNWRVITWVSDYRCPIWTFSNRTPIIGYPCDFQVNYARFNGFLSNVFYSFQNLQNRISATDVFAQKKFLEDIFYSEICHRYYLISLFHFHLTNMNTEI